MNLRDTPVKGSPADFSPETERALDSMPLYRNVPRFEMCRCSWLQPRRQFWSMRVRRGPNSGRHFQISAKCVSELHLPRCPAFGFKYQWGADKDTNAFCSRCRHIQSIRAIKKFHPSRRIRMTRCRHRIDNDWCFLTLELIG